MKPSDALVYRFFQPLFTLLFWILYNPKYVNKSVIPKNEPCVIAGNHNCILDPIYVYTSTPRVVHSLANKELHDGKFGWLFKSIGSIPVDMKAKHNGGALNAAIDYLNRGYAINVSPEGKRNFTEETLLPFKPGAVVMAQRTGCKLIPYAVTGEYKFRSRTLKITYGEPLDIKDLSVEEANQLLYDTVKQMMIENNFKPRKEKFLFLKKQYLK